MPPRLCTTRARVIERPRAGGNSAARGSLRRTPCTLHVAAEPPGARAPGGAVVGRAASMRLHAATLERVLRPCKRPCMRALLAQQLYTAEPE